MVFLFSDYLRSHKSFDRCLFHFLKGVQYIIFQNIDCRRGFLAAIIAAEKQRLPSNKN